MGISISRKSPGIADVFFREAVLTNKTTWAGTAAYEQWGTEEALLAQADAPATVDLIADLQGYMDSDSSGNNLALKVQVSLDGGSTWTDGGSVNIRNTSGATDERFPLYAYCMISGGTVTGDIQARVMGQVATNTTGRSLNNGRVKMIVKTAE